MQVKKCSMCSLSKNTLEYYKDKRNKNGCSSACRECISKRQRELYSPEKKEKQKKYKKLNPEKIKQWKLNDRVKNAEKYKQYKKEYYIKNKLILSAKYKENYHKNKHKIHQQLKERYRTDIQYKLSLNLRRRMYKLIKRNERNGSAVRDLGCSLEAFKSHIESKFQSGMSWENYGKWHLDHIYPLSLVDLTNREQFLKVTHYTNYQPLWAKDNIVKSNKLWYNDTIPVYKRELKMEKK